MARASISVLSKLIFESINNESLQINIPSVVYFDEYGAK
jgi:hypothetical protein